MREVSTAGRRPLQRGWPALLAAALVTAACTTTAADNSASTTTGGSTPGSATTNPTTTTTTIAEPPVNKLAWRACDGRFQCSYLVAPISYSKPSEGTIKIAVIELPATGAQGTARDLVLNPGGPGESGIGFLEQAWTSFPASLRQAFNLVSFDPRGVGQSDPVQCGSPASVRQWLAYNPVPETTTQIAQLVAEDKAFDRACAESVPLDVLANLSTEVTAHDLDRLRQALGQPRLDYLGFSYGTYLGSLYAQTFPDSVGALVLDGAVDPSLGMASQDSEQAASFQVDLDDFFSWCSGDSSCAAELPDPASDFADLINDAEHTSTIVADVAPALGGQTVVNFALAETGVISSLYSINTWPELGEAISQGLQGNGTLLDELALQYAGFNANGTESNAIAAQTAIFCLDHPAPSVASYPALATAFAKDSPTFGPSEAWSTLPCNYWPVPPTGEPTTLHLPMPLHILVVGSTHDPATPYAWAQALAKQLAGARLLTRSGDGHTGYFSSSCVQGWVDNFLQKLDTPPGGTVCSSNG